MASCIPWSNDFFPSATDWVFYKYLRLTVRNLSLRRTFLTCDSGSTVVCFLIALRCCRKVRGIYLENCCKAKLLFYVDTWHSGEKVSELVWASVSSLEKWGIWSRLSYFLLLWDNWSDINVIYLSYFFFFWFSNVGELNPRLCTCWADILIGVWYYNLRNPVKATSLSHPNHPGLSTKLPTSTSQKTGRCRSHPERTKR
jgi:hypothetical protein